MSKKISIEKDCLEEDLNTISRINELVKNVVYPHQVKKANLTCFLAFRNRLKKYLNRI